MRILSLTLGLALLSPLAYANLVEMSLDEQINIGEGDAIYAQAGGVISFPGDGCRMLITPGGSWFYGPRIDFIKAGYAPLDLTGVGEDLAFDAICYQDPVTNTNPYGDANIFVRIYSYDGITLLGYRDFGIVYGPNASSFPYGDWMNWNRVHVNLDGGTVTNQAPYVYDETKITQMRFYGTDWSGTGDDYIQVRDLVITPEPSALALLALGALATLRRR